MHQNHGRSNLKGFSWIQRLEGLSTNKKLALDNVTPLKDDVNYEVIYQTELHCR